MRAAPPQRARTHARPRRAQSKALKEGDANLAGEHLREGLAAVLAVRVPSPEFEGQTKTRLGNPEVRKLVDGVVAAGLADALEAEPATAAAVLGKALQAARAAEAARKARHPRGCPPGLRQPRGRPAGAASGPGPPGLVPAAAARASRSGARTPLLQWQAKWGAGARPGAARDHADALDVPG